MISAEEATQLIRKNTFLSKIIETDLYEATGFVLAEDLYALTDSPPFDQSAMDGYAYRISESDLKNPLTIVAEIAAGDFLTNFEGKNSAIRVFTGAMVPKEFDTVVMQEKTKAEGTKLFIQDETQKKGMNIRLKGSQITKGTLALKKGTYLNAASIGYLAGLGYNKVKVYQKPKVTIISTGNELVSPGQNLPPAKVYECNTYSLNAALHEMGIKINAIHKVTDNEEETTAVLKKCLNENDLIILSGGVSVGDYDFVTRALDNCGVQCIFHKVKQKPGKPMYFGMKEKILIFGLPGNPAALLTCFYEYVKPMVLSMQGLSYSEKMKLTLEESYTKKSGLTHFLKGKIKGTQVSILKSQESYLMNSFAEADCLVQLDEERSTFEKGEIVKVLALNL